MLYTREQQVKWKSRRLVICKNYGYENTVCIIFKNTVICSVKLKTVSYLVKVLFIDEYVK